MVRQSWILSAALKRGGAEVSVQELSQHPLFEHMLGLGSGLPLSRRQLPAQHLPMIQQDLCQLPQELDRDQQISPIAVLLRVTAFPAPSHCLYFLFLILSVLTGPFLPTSARPGLSTHGLLFKRNSGIEHRGPRPQAGKATDSSQRQSGKHS